MAVAGKTSAANQSCNISVHKEAVMTVLAFANPLYVKDNHQMVHEITCVEDALEFLYEWPKARRGSIYETARRRSSVNSTATKQASPSGDLLGLLGY